MHCFSMQVAMNKCFLLNPEKKFGADPSCSFREKRTNRLIPTHFNSEKIMSPSRRLGYSNNQLKTVNRLKVSFRLSETIWLQCQKSIKFPEVKIRYTISSEFRDKPLKRLKINYKNILLQSYH